MPRVEDTGCDGIELNFGCPHGMSERGMGSAVGQVPEYIQMVTEWCKEHCDHAGDRETHAEHHRYPLSCTGCSCRWKADAVSLINTRCRRSPAVNLDTMSPEPSIDGKGSHGGYCGPAVKPIALNMVAEIARDPETVGLPISAIGGVTTWRDAAEFLVLGAGNVQVCTAAMVYGFGIIKELTAGLSGWMDEKGYTSVAEASGRAVPNVTDWQYLNLNYVTKARIDQDACIKCGRCYAACEDTSHQAISMGEDRTFDVIDEECVACNLCVDVCPVEGCITMERLEPGTVDPRTAKPSQPDYANWTTHPNNPASRAAE